MSAGRVTPIVLALLVLVGAAEVARAEPPPIVGEWTIDSGPAAGKEVLFRSDGTGSLAGQEMQWQIVSQGVVRCSAGGEQIDFGYSVEGDRLTLTASGDAVTCRRSGSTPATPPAPSPAPAPAPANPLGAPSAPAFDREFKGDDIALSLSGSPAGYTGELTYGGSTFPVTAKSDGNRLSGEFTSGDQSFPFEATLTGDRLELTSGGKKFLLTGEAAQPAPAPVNPLAPSPSNPLAPSPADPAAPIDEPAPTPSESPEPLSGVDTGPATKFQHPKGYFSFDMPQGWTVFRQENDTIILNPGFKENDNIDALIVVSYGELEPAEQNRPINVVVDEGEKDLLAGLRQQGIQVQPAGRKSSAVLVGDVPGATQTWKGKNAAGKPLTLWFGGVTKREYYLTVLGIIVSGQEARFLPKVKRIFTTMAPKPPERNRAAEQALAGMSFFSTDSNPSGTFSTIYSFRQGNGVHKESLFSAGELSTDTSDDGRYEVVGTEVFLYFKDGQKSATLVVSNGNITGLKFGNTVYSVK